jgi:NMD protein affecting ribosome stability and mRNA decay
MGYPDTNDPHPGAFCRECGREIDEDSIRTVCIPCAARRQQDEAQARHRAEEREI